MTNSRIIATDVNQMDAYRKMNSIQFNLSAPIRILSVVKILLFSAPRRL
jgi:23S rRNA U2552 (ribose-2'-O)-methylase RlmE/FtsJ